MARQAVSKLAGEYQCGFFDAAEVELAGAEDGDGVDVAELVGAGFPEVREVARGELVEDGGGERAQG